VSGEQEVRRGGHGEGRRAKTGEKTRGRLVRRYLVAGDL